MPKSFKQFCESKKASNKKPPGGGEPYVATGKKADGKPLGDQGSQPVYTPGKSDGKGKKLASSDGNTVKNESFVAQTKKMSPKRFLEYMKTSGSNPLIYEVAQKTSHLLKRNPNTASALIHEAKRAGSLPRLVVEMTNHKEFFETFAAIIGDQRLGKGVANKLAKAVNEMVGPGPIGGGEPKNSMFKKKGPHIPSEDDELDDEFEDDDEFDDDDELEDDDMGMSGGEDDMSMGGDEDMGDEEGMGGDEDMSMGGEEEMGGDMDAGGGAGPMGGGGLGAGTMGGGGLGKPKFSMGGGMGGDSGMGLDDDPAIGGGDEEEFGDEGLDDEEDSEDGEDEFGGNDDELGELGDEEELGDEKGKNPFKKHPSSNFRSAGKARPSIMNRMMGNRFENRQPNSAAKNLWNAFKRYKP